MLLLSLAVPPCPRPARPIQAELLFKAIDRVAPKSGAELATANKRYLQRSVTYDGDRLIDEDHRGVMMQWEDPLMAAHAEIICQTRGHVLNVGFGLGLIDTHIQVRLPAAALMPVGYLSPPLVRDEGGHVACSPPPPCG